MRVLLTGATSFTGMWFAQKLVEDGHDVLAAIHRCQDTYCGLQAVRLAQLAGRCEFAWNVSFGSSEFLDLIARNGPFDILCHHAAEAKDHKSPDFDALAAAAANTRRLPAVLVALRNAGCRRILLTGSVFEAEEGTGTAPLRAFSPYGLSKTLTAEIFRFHAAQEQFALGKFVIPNPFGPYDGPRFTDYLVCCWIDGKAARVNTPAYVRDNVPVSLLAASYARFAAEIPDAGFVRLNPSYYAETQKAFSQRFAAEIGRRLKLEVPLEFADQTEFPEPAVRTNTDVLRGADFGWSEPLFWDVVAGYYAKQMNR